MSLRSSKHLIRGAVSLVTGAYVGRPETDQLYAMAMSVLGNGLGSAQLHTDALSVKEAQFSMMKRLDAPVQHLLVTQSNLANSYLVIGRLEEGLRMRQEVYSGYLTLVGEEHTHTIIAANNYAVSLIALKRFEEAKSLLRKKVLVAQRGLGENDETRLRMRWYYAVALYQDDAATLDDLREAVTTLEDAAPGARRVLGAAHPLVQSLEGELKNSRAALRARETPLT